ncbi:MAG TPA: C4-type zinc ribbon domain-containing protein [Thermoanaerobaculia bacterium]|nr:C4-type zinc ribbon domain-containing protein [Thermoanaerobaculia bacterium]
MEQPNAPLDRLFRLQEILLEVKRKTDKKERTPDHLTHIEAAYKDALKRRQEAGSRQSHEESRKKTLEGEVADLSEKLKKYQQQLVAVKTNREYGALLNEMDGVKREIRQREDEVLSLEESLAKTRAETAERDESFPEETAGYEEQMTEWRAEQAILTEEIARAEKIVSELREGLDRRLLSTFDRIARARSGVAVARVTMVARQTAACSACNVRLRPQLLSDLRLSKEPILCESCKRILYWDGRTIE